MATVAPSFQDLLDQGQAEAQARRPDLTFADGDVTVAQNHASGAMSDVTLGHAARLFKDTFIDGAEGDALTALVDDHCNIQRKAATAATALMSFWRLGGPLLAGSIPIGTQVAAEVTADGAQVVFTTDAAVAVGAGLTGPFNVNATAVEAGTGSNVGVGLIIKVLDQLFDTFTCSNASSDAGGGNEEETDEELRQRARAYFQTLHKGTAAALEFGALLVPGVRVARVIEDPEALVVQVAVSDSTGSSSVQMVGDVQAELENWRAAGSAVQVVGGLRAEVDAAIVLARVKAGFDVNQAATGIIASVTTRINKLSVSDTLYLDSLIAAVIAYAPDDIFDVTIVSLTVGGIPHATNLDVVPGANKLLRPGTITVSAA